MFAHFLFETVLFFLCQKEENGFNLPRKERGLSKPEVHLVTWVCFVFTNNQK